ncbi:MAG TPA: glycosyltransferase family 39 protein [Polyangia bacterium]|jgi:4-amino-4-deoxy-L-arabinose transferase-like glycosyltransferase
MGGLIALGFLARLVWVLAVPSRPVGDFALYRESASYLVEHHALDPEFIYMPGYVFLLAAVEWLGGGLLAAKLLGVVAGTAVVAAAGGIGAGLFDRRTGLTAAALAALWPAGIAVTSVTGTDLPAGALVALAIWALVKWGRDRPWTAAAVFGLLMGLGAWVRAVAAPLAALSFFYWWVIERRAPRAATRAALGVAVAFVVLLPWALRNQYVYGDFFFTDSHGGHTALVGANPNSEGTYSRSLNVMFTKGTGFRLMDTPARHRASDRAAYELAKGWTSFSPAYAAGLLVAKADRLLSHERNLLYWPIYRQGVLPAARREFLDAHRTALERLADGFWWGIVGLFVAGVSLTARARDRRALALLAFPAAMVVIYASFFSEVRYHLAIAPLLFPLAAFALTWMVASFRRRFAADGRAWLGVALPLLALFAGWPALVAGGAALRARARWAVDVCAYPTAGETHLCTWRRTAPAGGPSPVRGVWDGVGLRVGAGGSDDGGASARTSMTLERGRYRLSGLLAVKGAGTGPDVVVAITAADRVIMRAVLPRGASGDVPVEGLFDHDGGNLPIGFAVEPNAIGSTPDGATIWFSQLVVERFPPLVIIPRR